MVNAHRVLSGRNLDPDPAGAGGQFFFIRARDAERAHEVLVKMATERIPEAYGLDPVEDIQVLCPMHKGRATRNTTTDAIRSFIENFGAVAATDISIPQDDYCEVFPRVSLYPKDLRPIELV